MKTTLTKNKKGFTIIEVMIVLAIAGLILAIIFLAVPALQRNSRNNSRRNDAAHLAGLVNEFVANHAGQLPICIASSGTCTGTPSAPLDLGTENWAIMNAPATADIVTNSNNAAGGTTSGSTSTMKIDKGTTCSGGTITTGAPNRAFSIIFAVEKSSGSEQTCIQG